MKSERVHDSLLQGLEVRNVCLIEGLGELSQHHIAVARIGSRHDASAVAPQIFLALLFRAVGLLLVAAPLNTQATVGITGRLTGWIVTIGDIIFEVVLLDPSVDVLDIHGDRLPQVRDLVLQVCHRSDQDRLQMAVVEGL